MLRTYQEEAIQGVQTTHLGGKKSLVVMATGTGKTHVFVHYMAKMRGRTMIVANREELVQQAMKKVNEVGVPCDVEQANYWADEANLHGHAQCVVASIQSLNAKWKPRWGDPKKRMNRFNWSQFDLLVIDEAHHAVSKSYLDLIALATQQNPNIKILGVTATPDRLDKRGMGTVFDEVSYRYEMDKAIDDSWLVPITQSMIHVDSLDFSSVKTTAGDFNVGELARLMEYETHLQSVAVPTVEQAGDGRAVLFATSVNQAERIAEIINRMRPGKAVTVDGKTDKVERKRIFEAFAKGDYQFLCNCQVATEGWDCPEVELVAIARPTKSRALYTQMVGRGTRPLPEVFQGTDNAADRKARIGSSRKTQCRVLDFVGNSGHHHLICTADILAGDNEVVAKRVRHRIERGEETEVQEMVAEEKIRLSEERKEIERKRREGLVADVSYSTRTVDPFNLLAVKPKRSSQWTNNNPISPAQENVLIRAGIEVHGYEPVQQRQILEQIWKRRKKGLCTLKQMKMLVRLGVPIAEAKKMPFEQASTKIDSIRNVSSTA